MRLPTCLAENDDHAAADLVRRYMAEAPTVPGGVAYTGSLFNSWDGGGDRLAVRDRFTDADVTSVGFLSVTIPSTAVIELLQTRHERLDSLLAQIPADLDLHAAGEEQIASSSHGSLLWLDLMQIDGISWVTAGKLLARKRPRLFPVYDNVVAEVVGHPTGLFWASLRTVLQADDMNLARRLADIGRSAGSPELSVLRIFDVIAWMTGKQAS